MTLKGKDYIHFVYVVQFVDGASIEGKGRHGREVHRLSRSNVFLKSWHK